jgi:hypothetical protein
VIAVALVLVMAFGFSITLLLARQSALLERLALAYFLGWGFLTLLMFCVSLLGVPLSISSTATPLVIITASLASIWCRKEGKRLSGVARSLRDFRNDTVNGLQSLSIVEKALVALAGVFLLYSFVMACYWPVWWWDAVAVYDLRAKVFFDTRSIAEAASQVSAPQYVMTLPPMTSLAHTWVYLWGGASPKFFYPLLFASFIIMSYYFMREYCSTPGSLTFSALLSSTFIFVNHSTDAFTNLPFACYYSVATIYLYRWMLHQAKGDLIIAGFALGLSGWVRGESQAFFIGYCAVLALHSLRRKKYLAPLAFAVPYLAIEPIWALYVRHVLHLVPWGGWGLLGSAIDVLMSYPLKELPQLVGGLGSVAKGAATLIMTSIDLTSLPTESVDWTHLLAVLSVMWRSLAESHGVLLCVFVVMTLLNLKYAREHGYLLLLALSNAVLFVLAIFLLSYLELVWQPVVGSADRLFMFVSPSLIYYVASTKSVRELFRSPWFTPRGTES